MLAYLSPLAISIWVATIILQFWVCALLRKGNARTFPAFRAYVYVCVVGAPVAFVLAALLKPRVYTVAYYVVTLSADILVFFVAHEIYCEVFGPRKALPKFVPERTATMMAISFTAAVSLSLILHATQMWFKWLLTTEQALTAAAFATFWILFTYSKSLRITWLKRVWEIWTGFALYLTISIIAVFIRARASAPLAIAADRTAQISYLLAVAWWGWRLREEDEVVTPMTRDEVQEMRKHHEHTMEQLRRAGIFIKRL